jgi:outer membrane protein assembly factor BamB
MPKTAKTEHPDGIWSIKLANVSNAVLPSHTPRPNPVVTADRVIASIFSPGGICAVSRQDGRLLWRTELDSYGGSACIPHDRRLYATSCRSVYALNPRSGDVLWKFTPYGDPGEWIYSQPALGYGRVFIGDRKGTCTVWMPSQENISGVA